MQKRNRAITFFIVLVFALVVSAHLHAQQTEETTPSKSCLWEVKTTSTRVFLLGSLHILKSSAYPLALEIDRAYASSQRLVFETDIGAMMDPAILA